MVNFLRVLIIIYLILLPTLASESIIVGTLSNFSSGQPFQLNFSNASGDNTISTVYFNGSAGTNFSTVWVSDSTSTTVFPHYTENNTTGSTWINATSSTFIIHFGNTSRSSTSNANTTGVFFDDFNRADGTVGNNWTIVSGTWTISSSELAQTTQLDDTLEIYNTGFNDSSYIVEATGRILDEYNNNEGIYLAAPFNTPYTTAGSDYLYAGYFRAYNTAVKSWSINGALNSTNVDWTYGTNYSMKLIRQNNNVSFYNDNVLKANTTIGISRGYPGVMSQAVHARFDNFRARRITSVPFVETSVATVSASASNIIPIVASDTIQYSSDSEVGTYSYPTLQKLKEITINENLTGSWKINFEMASGVNTVAGQIYKNDIPYGSLQTTSSTSFVLYSETFSFTNIQKGDKISLYGRGSYSLNAVSLKNFRIMFNYDYINYTPALTYPVNSSSISFTYPPQFGDVNFTWSNINLSGYQINIAKDPNFILMTWNNTVSVNYDVVSLEATTYYWRVRTYNSGTVGSWSPTSTFTLTATTSGGTLINASQGVVYQILNDGSSSPISGVKVEIYNSTYYNYMITSSNGYYAFQNLYPNQTYNLKASKVDEFDDSPIIPVTIVYNSVATTNILMQKCTSVFNCFYNKQWVVFALQDIYFNRYSKVLVSTYLGSSLNVDASETSDYSGKVTFLMIKNQQYRITLVNTTQGINQEVYLTPGDGYYVLFITPTPKYFKLPNNSNDNLIITPSSYIVNNTHAYVNLSYVNTTGHNSNVFVNITLMNVDGTNSTLNTTSATINNDTFYYLFTPYAGKSVIADMIIKADDDSILYHYKYGFTFNGMPNNPYANNITFLGYIAVVLILFVASFFSESTSGIGGLIVSGFGLLMFNLGFMEAPWFGNYISIILGICVIISILHIINTKNSKEGFS